MNKIYIEGFITLHANSEITYIFCFILVKSYLFVSQQEMKTFKEVTTGSVYCFFKVAFVTAWLRKLIKPGVRKLKKFMYLVR